MYHACSNPLICIGRPPYRCDNSRPNVTIFVRSARRSLPRPSCPGPTSKGRGKLLRRENSIKAFWHAEVLRESGACYPPITGARFAPSEVVLASLPPVCYHARMTTAIEALKAGDQLLKELQGPVHQLPAPTMGRLKRCSYTHEALIDLIIEHPEMDQNEIAAYFGYTPGWISNILASDALQSRMAVRREKIIDPELRATIEERFRALTIRSLQVLQAKLNAPQVSDNVALRAAELGAKALGIGGNAPPPSPGVAADRLERLAERLVSLQRGIRERVLDEKDGIRVEIGAA